MLKAKNIHRWKYMITVLLNAMATTIVYFSIVRDYQNFEVILLLVIALLVSMFMQYASKFFFNPSKTYDGRIVIDAEDPNKDTITIEYLDNPLNMADKKTATFLIETKGL